MGHRVDFTMPALYPLISRQRPDSGHGGTSQKWREVDVSRRLALASHKPHLHCRAGLGNVVIDGTATNCDNKDVRKLTRRYERSAQEPQSLQAAQARLNELLAAQNIPIIKKSDVRVGKRTDSPTLICHIFVRRVRFGT